MKGKSSLRVYMLFIASILLIISSCKKNEDDKTIMDADGNLYTSVTIGTQVWLVENLKTTKLNDGTAISYITEQTAWSNTSEPAYCWYDKNISNKDPYGALYNWYAVESGKLCPKGWHVPSEAEWTELVNFLGGESVAGGKLKTTGTIEDGDGVWYEPNVDATNETGFSILPGGYLSSTFKFWDIGYGGVWWTSTEYPSDLAYYFYINNYNGEVGDSETGMDKNAGLSVRCLQD